MSNILNIGVETYDINGSPFGIILRPSYMSQRMEPVFRVAVTTVKYETDPKKGKVRYQLFSDGIPTGRFFEIRQSHPEYGWALPPEQKHIIEFLSNPYFVEVDDECNTCTGQMLIHLDDAFYKSTIFPLLGDEPRYRTDRHIDNPYIISFFEQK